MIICYLGFVFWIARIITSQAFLLHGFDSFREASKNNKQMTNNKQQTIIKIQID